MITPRYCQLVRNIDSSSVGSNNTLLTTGPMGFQFKPGLNIKTKQEGCFIFPEGSFSLSFTHSLLLSLSLPTLAAFIQLPELRRYTTHRGGNTHRHLEVENTRTEKKEKAHWKEKCTLSHTHTHTHTHTHIGIYTDTVGPISGCCQQGDRG